MAGWCRLRGRCCHRKGNLDVFSKQKAVDLSPHTVGRPQEPVASGGSQRGIQAGRIRLRNRKASVASRGLDNARAVDVLRV